MKRLIGLSSGVRRVATAGVLATVLAAAVIAAPAQAQAAGAGLRIAVVNYGQLLQESPQGRAVMATLNAEFLPKQRSLQAQANELKAREASLKKNQATMTQDQLDQAQLDLRERYQDLARKQSEIQDDATTRRNELMSKLQKTLAEAVQSYAKQQGYDLVLADGFIYANNALDITPAILSALKSQGGRVAPARRK